MIKFSVLYPQQENARFDTGYYLTTHIPLVMKRWGSAVKSVSVEEGVSGGIPGSAPAYVMMAHFTFESVEAFQAAFAPHASEIMADIPNYTSIQAILQISEIKFSQ